MRKYDCTYDGPEEYSDGGFVLIDDVEDLIQREINVLKKIKNTFAQSGSEYGEGIAGAKIRILETILEEVLK